MNLLIYINELFMKRHYLARKESTAKLEFPFKKTTIAN